MKLNLQHAQEFTRILEKPNFKAQGLDNDGNFIFGFKLTDSDTQMCVDPGMVATLIQLKKSVDRGQSPEEALEEAKAKICAELKL